MLWKISNELREIELIVSRDDAYKLLRSLNAPGHLLTHVVLVGEAADLLIEKCEAFKE